MKLVGFLYCRTPLSLFLYFIDRFELQPFFIHMLVRMRICSQEQFYIWTSVCFQSSTWNHILLTIEVSFEILLQTVMSVSKSMAHEREKLMCLEFSPPWSKILLSYCSPFDLALPSRHPFWIMITKLPTLLVLENMALLQFCTPVWNLFNCPERG